MKAVDEASHFVILLFTSKALPPVNWTTDHQILNKDSFQIIIIPEHAQQHQNLIFSFLKEIINKVFGILHRIIEFFNIGDRRELRNDLTQSLQLTHDESGVQEG